MLVLKNIIRKTLTKGVYQKDLSGLYTSEVRQALGTNHPNFQGNYVPFLVELDLIFRRFLFSERKADFNIDSYQEEMLKNKYGLQLHYRLSLHDFEQILCSAGMANLNIHGLFTYSFANRELLLANDKEVEFYNTHKNSTFYEYTLKSELLKGIVP